MGAEKVANIRNRSRTVAIEVYFSFYFAVVSPMNRKNAATWYMAFFSFTTRIAYLRTESFCVTIGDARRAEKKSAK
jgi:hypothetical protein